MPPFSASGTQQSVVPSSLPFLPGNGFKDPTQTNFHKKQIFDVKGGIPTVRDPAPRNSPPPANASFSAASYGGKGAMMDSVVSKGAAPADDTKAVPAWVAFDRKVLRFNCYFKESVHESRLENYRIRNCVLYYYLEDDSMHISEPKIENSGIPQGERKGTVFLKRHRVPKPDSPSSFYAASDLAVGRELDLYGRVFLITDADAFTRAFYAKVGAPLEEPIPVPHDPYTTSREEMKEHIVRNQKYFHPRPAEDDLIRTMEARLGASSTILGGDKLDQFLKYDRRVLRFYMAWDDRKSLYGELRPFVMHYYLADDTMEILEVRRANSGRDPFPLFLKRGKVYKQMESYLNVDAPTTHTTQLIDRTGQVDPTSMATYTDADFAVGKQVNINGCEFLIYGCDEFTRDYYDKVYGEHFEDIPVEFDESVERPQMVIPPHVSPGSEEDSLGSFLYLIPKVPKKNFRRMMENDRKILRFLAHLDTDNPEDRGRVFVIKYFLADDTVAVFEPPTKNSGIIGGKFLERCRVKRPGTNDFYTQADFFTGAKLEFNRFKFVIHQADEYSLSYMEADAESHPMSNLQYIAEQLVPVLAEKRESLIGAFKSHDPSDSGAVGYEAFQDVLSQHEMELNDQVLITLLRKFDRDACGAVSYMDFLDMA
uniref:EF-hand domain-containing protein n=1 Tax=Chrysotila carterae TaxID=13221 RepID=A0A7S4B0V8_CHRCT